MFKSLFKKLGTLGASFLLFEITDWLFMLAFFPVVHHFGPLKGGALMTLIALTANFYLARAYDHMGDDPMGFEWMREKRKWGLALSDHIWSIFSWIMYVVLVIGLTMWEPLLAFFYIQKKRHKDEKFKLLDWAILGILTVVSCVGLTTLTYYGLYLLGYLKQVFTS